MGMPFIVTPLIGGPSRCYKCILPVNVQLSSGLVLCWSNLHIETLNVEDFQVVPETGCSLIRTKCWDEITVARVALNVM